MNYNEITVPLRPIQARVWYLNLLGPSAKRLSAFGKRLAGKSYSALYRLGRSDGTWKDCQRAPEGEGMNHIPRVKAFDSSFCFNSLSAQRSSGLGKKFMI